MPYHSVVVRIALAANNTSQTGQLRGTEKNKVFFQVSGLLLQLSSWSVSQHVKTGDCLYAVAHQTMYTTGSVCFRCMNLLSFYYVLGVC